MLALIAQIYLRTLRMICMYELCVSAAVPGDVARVQRFGYRTAGHAVGRFLGVGSLLAVLRNHMSSSSKSASNSKFQIQNLIRVNADHFFFFLPAECSCSIGLVHDPVPKSIRFYCRNFKRKLPDDIFVKIEKNSLCYLKNNA